MQRGSEAPDCGYEDPRGGWSSLGGKARLVLKSVVEDRRSLHLQVWVCLGDGSQ